MFGSLTIKCLYLHRQNSNAAKMWTPQASYFYAQNNKQTIQTAPGVVADNAHKGFAFETLTTRSAAFQFMSKYQML